MNPNDAKSLESEVASYILGKSKGYIIIPEFFLKITAAYLLQNNLKASANAFLQECDVLPSKTFIVCRI